MGATEEFFQAVQAGPASKVDDMLRRDKSLLAAKSPKMGLSPVTVAAYFGQTEVLQTILRHNPSLDVHEAALVGNAERVRELVDKDPRLITAISKDGFPPLGLAAYMGQKDVVEYLVGKGSDLEHAAQGSGFTALTGAISNGHEEIVELLLRHGAKAEYHYEDGKLTPLHAAIMHGSVRMVKSLLEHGADPNAKMTTGQSALGLAEGKDVPPIIDLLKQHGAK